MGYPTGPLLAALADRILANLDLIEARAPEWGSPRQNEPPYADTQLLVSLLGVLIFPHEMAPFALGNLLRNYKPLNRVLKIRYSLHGDNKVELTDADGEAVLVNPAILTNLPTLLRNSVAHFNVLPIDKGGRFAGIRVWNRADRRITFVADIDFDELRLLARHVLHALREQQVDVPLEDPHDPMIEVEEQRHKPMLSELKVPRLNRDIWERLVDGHSGDSAAAKIKMDQLLKKEADRLLVDLEKTPHLLDE
jgi:hypothetical protein